jgi:predicted permease
MSDLRYAVRVFAKSPFLTTAAVLCLALGIGANTAIFSVLNAVLLKPLPFPEPERLVAVVDVMPQGDDPALGPADFLDLRQWNQSLELVTGHAELDVNLTGVERPERIRAETVSPSFFDVLGVPPFLGRSFFPDSEPSGKGVYEIVLSTSSWQRRFGADPEIVGRSVFLDGQPHTVVGVAPASFDYPEGVEMWVRSYRFGLPEPPITAPDEVLKRVRRFGYIRLVGRLAEGVSLEQARAELDIMARRLAESDDADRERIGMDIRPLRENVVGTVRPALLTLLGAVGFVLLIACANVAHLMLTRAATREKEVAVRAALGASRRRLLRQFLLESMLLGLAGGGLGILLALWGVDALVRAIGGDIPRVAEIGIDGAVLLFTTAVSLLAGVVFGFVPAHSASRLDYQTALREGGRGSEGARSRRYRGTLVISEVALSFVLLVGVGLLLTSLVRLQREEPGFQAGSVLVMRVDLPEALYPEEEDQAAFFHDVIARVERLPGVVSAGCVFSLPFSGRWAANDWEVVGRPRPDGERTARWRTLPDGISKRDAPLFPGHGHTPSERADVQ